ncbi:MAG: hypothetical protein ACFHWZ_15985 [Phycisphaerales bacterium]
MFRRQKRSFWHDFRTFFVRGLVILLPSLLTLAILLWAYNFLKSNIAEPINWAVQRVVIQAVPQVYPNELDRPSWYLADRDEIIRRAPSSYRNYADLPTGQRRSITRQIRSEQLREYWRALVPSGNRVRRRDHRGLSRWRARRQLPRSEALRPF